MVVSRLSMIMTQDELDRIKVSEDSNGKVQITADVHGMKCYQAKRFINNIINALRIAFVLIVIHGYTHGTAIKEMLFQNFSNEHISNQYADSYNYGITHMVITE